MAYKIILDDPFNVLTSTKDVVENSSFVAINTKNLEQIGRFVADCLQKGLNVAEASFGSTGNFEDDVQLIFLEDVVNFCFWNEKGKPRWQVKWPKGEISGGGWYSLVNCFRRALAEGLPILDAEFLADLTNEDTRLMFRGEDGVEIPLLKERRKNLQEAGEVLNSRFDGKFINVLEKAEFDAVKTIEMIYKNFPSFRDKAILGKKEIFFLKRAQICVHDLSHLFPNKESKTIKNLNKLTAFADYKLPQLLRSLGLFIYASELAAKVDNCTIIAAGSQEEIEIRSVTIWCVELLRQSLASYTAGEIDNALWLLSQNQKGLKPHHRTYTIFY